MVVEATEHAKIPLSRLMMVEVHVPVAAIPLMNPAWQDFPISNFVQVRIRVAPVLVVGTAVVRAKRGIRVSIENCILAV